MCTSGSPGKGLRWKVSVGRISDVSLQPTPFDTARFQVHGNGSLINNSSAPTELSFVPLVFVTESYSHHATPTEDDAYDRGRDDRNVGMNLAIRFSRSSQSSLRAEATRDSHLLPVAAGSHGRVIAGWKSCALRRDICTIMSEPSCQRIYLTKRPSQYGRECPDPVQLRKLASIITSAGNKNPLVSLSG
jgi:hypothetical protein